MKNESEAISRLTDIQSEVSCHYLIKNNGEIITMVPESYSLHGMWVNLHGGVASL